MKISVVIPSYNEMANLQKGTLEKVERYMERRKFHYEVLVVDDGSTDGSLEFVKEFTNENRQFKLIENSHTGKAGAVTAGMLRASGDLILFTDMDQATPITELEKLIPFTEKGYDIVIGSRSTTRRGAPFTRKIMSQGMITLRSLLVGLPQIHDTQCGFKLFKKKPSDKVFEKIKKIHKGFKSIHGSSVTAGFDVELLYIAEKFGYKIKEVPVDWLYVETRRVNPIFDSIDGLMDLIRIRQNIFKRVYD
ncbi:MAG TPA: glycosyltransferase [Candidatus Levybacteria bacterium]|nr:glycosyltransferase [Candidatus Levybacteria bacterium]